MKTNLEKQGIRAWYIIGGIFTLILAAFLIILYLPALLSVFNIEPMWDMTDTFTNMFGEHIMTFIADFGVLIVLGLVFLLSLASIALKPSMSATNFRLTKVFAALGLALPQVADLIKTSFDVDITNYVSYGVLGLFVLAFLFYLIGMINRAIKKFNPNKATTYLVFSATIWFLLILITAACSANEMFALNIAMLDDIKVLLTDHLLAILGVFFAFSAIWMFITIPNRVRVEYNTTNKYSPKTKDGKARPTVMQPGENQGEVQKTKSNPNEKFDHQYTSNEPNQAIAQTPALNTANNIATQPVNAYPNRPAQTRPTVQQPQANTQPFSQQPAYNQPYGQQPRPVVQPNTAPQQPTVQSQTAPRMAAQNPFAQNATQTAPFAMRQPTQQTTQPYGQTPQQPRPMTQQPYGQTPRPATPAQPYNQAPRPAQPYGQVPQQPRPMNPTQPNAQAPRPATPTQPYGQQPRPAMPTQPYGQPPRPAQQPANPNRAPQGTNGNPNNPNAV